MCHFKNQAIAISTTKPSMINERWNRTVVINTCSPAKPVMVNERWVCPCCKTQKTYHGQSVFWRTPITDDHVFQGRCLKCFPDFTPNTSSLRVVS
eukprot:Sro1644_g288201.1  (95) ;mRNA; f:20676-21889